MMSSSYNEVLTSIPRPVISLAYPDIASLAQLAQPDQTPEEPVAPVETGPSPEEIDALVQRARAEAAAETERRLRTEYETRLAAEAARIQDAVRTFASERTHYFSKVEAEVIRLSLAIAGKILHREAQVDPMLVAALVRLAIEKMEAGSNVTIRVSAQKYTKWRSYFSDSVNGCTITVAEDPDLADGDCVLETTMGSANFSVEAQLKEVEQGFFDLLAQRPA